MLATYARAATISGADYQGGDLIPANGDTLSGTFTNVRRFEVGPGTTAFVGASIPLVVYASTISIDGVIDGTGRGQSGGAGGPINGIGLPGFGGSSTGSGGGFGGAVRSGGGGGAGGGPGGAGAGADGGLGGGAYGSTGTITGPLSADDLFMGSGGGGGGGRATLLPGGTGASGGGAVYLEASSVTITGAILVSGATAAAVTDGSASPHPGGGGGGGGGTILLRVPGYLQIYSGARLAANGGGGGNVDTLVGGTLDPGGGGGGGLIKIFGGQPVYESVLLSTAAGPPGGHGGSFSGTTDPAGLSISGTTSTVSFGLIASSPTAFSAQAVYVTSISWVWQHDGNFGDAPVASQLFQIYPATVTAPFPGPEISVSNLAPAATTQNLVPNTTYYRFVTAATDWGASLLSNAATGFTLADVPAPGAAVFSAMGDSTLTLNWTSGANVNPSYTRYEVNAATSANFAAPVSTGFIVALASAPVNLTPNTTYFFRVRAINVAGVPTNFLAVQSTATLATAPSAPGFSSVNVTSAVFTWSGGSNPGDTNYVAQMSTDNFFTLADSSATRNTSAVFSNLVPGLEYFFKVLAINRNSVPTAFSAVTSTHVGILTNVSPPTTPGAPEPDRLFSYDGTSTFTWTPAASPVGIFDYNLEIGTSGGASDFFSGNVSITSYTAAGMTSGRTYYARVRARSNAGVYGSFSASGGGVAVFVSSQTAPISKAFNWPNPFDPAQGATQIGFRLEAPGPVVLKVYTLRGALVRQLTQTFATAGNQVFTWDGKNESGAKVIPGGYIGVITSPGGTAMKVKMAVVY